MLGSGKARPEPSDWLAYVLAVVPGAFLATLAGTGILSEQVALLLFVPSFIGLNLAHMAASWGRAYLDDRRWKSAWIERIAIPACLVIGSLALDVVGFGALLLALQYWLSIHHAGMQNYGILRSSQRRAGRVLGQSWLRLDQAACVMLPLGALAYRARVVCQSYDGVTIPAPPSWLVAVLLVGGASALVLYLMREVIARLRGEPVDALGIGLVLLTNLTWSALIMGMSHPALPLYALASGHYIQQLYFVWRFESRRSGFAALPSGLRRYVAPPARLGYLAGLTVAGGIVVSLLTLLTVIVRQIGSSVAVLSPEAMSIPPWLAAMIGVNLSHYWLEHRIWRSPKPVAQGAAPAVLPVAS